jgi:tetratricopeptide (TPR) repeat protein
MVVTHRLSLSVSGVEAAENPQAAEALALGTGGDALAEANPDVAVWSYRKALSIFKALAAAHPGKPQWQHNAAACHECIGDVLLAADNDREGALAEYRKALSIFKALAAAHPDNRTDFDMEPGWNAEFDSRGEEWLQKAAVCHDIIGDVLAAAGDREGALTEYRAAFAINDEFAAANPLRVIRRHPLAISYEKIGDMLAADGDREGAIDKYRTALTNIAQIEKLFDFDPVTRDGFQRYRAAIHGKKGDVLAEAGDRPGALAEYRASFAITDKLATAYPGDATARSDLAIGHDRIGEILAETGDSTGALAEYNASVAIREKLVAADPDNAALWQSLLVSKAKVAVLQKSGLVSPETVQNGGVPRNEGVPDTPSSGAAVLPPLGMADVTEAIDRLAAIVPNGKARKAFKAKVLAEFEVAAGISVRPDLTAIRLAAVFETLKRTSDLGNPKLSAAERRRRAKHLLKTYDRLCERDPQFHDDSDALRGARHIVNQDNYRRRKAKQAAQIAAD